ncbi:ATP-binding protein [Streptomyces sp. NPDC096132]|uniref:ATP-binding protein n=1 Tax=Streptomyces sp. NPDC096132 TaxID=3366075 RepID=UPI00380D0B91
MRGDELAPTQPAVVPVTSAASARAHARAVVDAHWGDRGRPVRERDVIDLLLVVSELVTNAIRHGGGLAGFEVTPVPDGVRLRVHDHSDALPAVAHDAGELPAGHRVSGYGWPLIVRLSHEIAIEARPAGGKTIRVLVPLRLTTAGRREPASPPRPAPR